MEPAQTPSTGYTIRVAGHLSPQWADWFEGWTITLEDGGGTCISGAQIDQAALYGLLKKVRDLGLVLISVNPVDPHRRGRLPPARRISRTSIRKWIDARDREKPVMAGWTRINSENPDHYKE